MINVGMKVNAASKAGFFNRQAVINAVGRANAKNLSKAGAYIRQTGRFSLRRRKKSSKPGSPPSVHARDQFANLRNIRFSWDMSTGTMVVGSLKLNQVVMLNGSASSVPNLMEFGGINAIKEVSRDQGATWAPADGRYAKRSWYRYRTRYANYAPRPYMQPALEANLPKFPMLWKNSVRAAA